MSALQTESTAKFTNCIIIIICRVSNGNNLLYEGRPKILNIYNQQNVLHNVYLFRNLTSQIVGVCCPDSE